MTDSSRPLSADSAADSSSEPTPEPTPEPRLGRPAVVSAAAQAAFEAQARRMGLDPAHRWIGGYVDYEWDHLRHILQALPVGLPGLRTLEFGCNVGASAVLLAHLGAQVSGVDIEPEMVALARCNAERFGQTGVDFRSVADTRRMPFPDRSFDLVACNSVLEYVPAEQLVAVQREIDRVLAPGGLILVTGTSNRLWPVEVHSRQWGSNYLPRALDRFFAEPPVRGLWPWQARHGFGAGYLNLDSAAADGFFAHSRRLIGTSAAQVGGLRAAAALLGVGPGLLGHSMSCLLRKAD